MWECEADEWYDTSNEKNLIVHFKLSYFTVNVVLLGFKANARNSVPLPLIVFKKRFHYHVLQMVRRYVKVFKSNRNNFSSVKIIIYSRNFVIINLSVFIISTLFSVWKKKYYLNFIVNRDYYTRLNCLYW